MLKKMMKSCIFAVILCIFVAIFRTTWTRKETTWSSIIYVEWTLESIHTRSRVTQRHRDFAIRKSSFHHFIFVTTLQYNRQIAQLREYASIMIIRYVVFLHHDGVVKDRNTRINAAKSINDDETIVP